jgi:hypothetical protein
MLEEKSYQVKVANHITIKMQALQFRSGDSQIISLLQKETSAKSGVSRLSLP